MCTALLPPLQMKQTQALLIISPSKVAWYACLRHSKAAGKCSAVLPNILLGLVQCRAPWPDSCLSPSLGLPPDGSGAACGSRPASSASAGAAAGAAVPAAATSGPSRPSTASLTATWSPSTVSVRATLPRRPAEGAGAAACGAAAGAVLAAGTCWCTGSGCSSWLSRPRMSYRHMVVTVSLASCSCCWQLR